MREYWGIVDPPLIVKEESPKKSYHPKQQKNYYHKVAQLFKGMTEIRENQRQNGHTLNNAHLIEEWFKLILQIIEDEYMLKELRKSLKETMSEEEGEAERPSANLPEKAY